MSGLLKGRTWWKRSELKKSYDVVIIGGGGHGMATAYYLAKVHGIKNVAVLEKNYIGAGGTGRNTTIIRSNYRTPEGIRFYERSMELFRGLSQELDINMMLSTLGHFTLAHTDSSVRVQRERGETNRLLGVNSKLIGREEIAELCPELNMSNDVAYPIQAALYHPPGADAAPRRGRVGLRHAAPYHQGVHLHQGIEVTGIRKDSNGRCMGVDTTSGPDRRGHRDLGRRRLDDADLRHGGHPHADHEPSAAGVRDRAGEADAAQDPGVGEPARVRLADRPRRVPDRLGDRALHDVQLPLHVHVHAALRGERARSGAAARAAQDPAPVDGVLRHDARLLADHGRDPGVENFYLDAGWGTWGFKATAVCGETMAEMAATRKTPELIAPFRLSRFNDEQLVPEKAAASVSH